MIDHNVLHELITDYVKIHDMESCEIVLGNMCDIIISKCEQLSIEIKELSLSLFPEVEEDLLWVDEVLTKVHHRSTSMPAFGTYKCYG